MPFPGLLIDEEECVWQIPCRSMNALLQQQNSMRLWSRPLKASLAGCVQANSEMRLVLPEALQEVAVIFADVFD